MTWALGIDTQDGKFVGEFLRSSGDIEYRALEDLTNLGIPSVSHITRRVGVTTPFSTWQHADTSEYLNALGILLPESVTSKHTVFEFTVLRTRFLVPALTLMRGLFQPNKYLLPAMFRAQAVDNACFMEYTSTPPTLTIDAFWAQPGCRCMNEGIKEALSWMYSFPSAGRMAGSVHDAARKGKIDIILPIGEARLKVRGLKIGKNFYVIDITFANISTSETSLMTPTIEKSLILFVDQSDTTTASSAIPLRQDRTVELSNFEWNVVGSVLLDGMICSRTKLDQRLIFDGILAKISSGLPWRKVVFKTGTWNNASQAYRHWLKRGTFHKAIAVLKDLRSHANQLSIAPP